MMLTNERLAAGIRFGTVLLLGTTMAAAGVSRATAQDASAEESHPAHIHAGSCGPNLGDVVYPLTNVSDNGMAEGTMASMATPGAGGMASPEAGAMGQMMGAASAVPVETSYTVVNASLQDLLSKPYAINVHESKAKIQNYIACGDLGGEIKTGPGMMQGGTLTIGLKELNKSGYSGVAVLQGQGNQTRVVLFLAKGSPARRRRRPQPKAANRTAPTAPRRRARPARRRPVRPAPKTARAWPPQSRTSPTSRLDPDQRRHEGDLDQRRQHPAHGYRQRPDRHQIAGPQPRRHLQRHLHQARHVRLPLRVPHCTEPSWSGRPSLPSPSLPRPPE